jgi:hypothetical protein
LGLKQILNKFLCVVSEVLVAVVLKSSVFRDEISCSLLKANLCFGGKIRLHLQARKISQARNQREGSYACHLLHAGFFLRLFFDPEDGGDMFLRNVRWLSTDYKALYPRR